ncbi:ATP-NAD kinase-like domain-containing protein [Aspergillus ambiguus]|uniref:diacylglycerol/lipid kinase family protein n=1 Tax=Aspergillus ambiguus TaxID=176160 RepID=UPI003CCE0A3D
MSHQMDSNTDVFECYEVEESRIRCHNPQKGEDISILCGDIVCLLSGDGEGKHTLLYLKHEGPRDSAKASVYLQSIQTASAPTHLLSRYLCEGLPEHFSFTQQPALNIHFVISTHSGTGLAETYYDNVLRPLISHVGLLDYKVHKTRSEKSVTELCQSTFIPCAEAGLPQTIVFLSGDGGVVDTIDTFYKSANHLLTPPIIALIPMGTGNAMASSMGLLANPAAGLVSLLRGVPKPLPTLAASFSTGAQYVTDEGRTRVPIVEDAMNHQPPKVYGGVVASWGMHASLVADSDTVEYRKYGAERFKMAANELLYPSDGSETHRYVGSITLTRRDSQTGNECTTALDNKDHMYVLVTLVPRLEKDFLISPETRPLDGSLRLVHFGPTSPENAMRLMGCAYQGGRHVNEEGVSYVEIEKLRIDFHEPDERWRRVCIDGKIVAVESGGWLEVCRERRSLLNILAPVDL